VERANHYRRRISYYAQFFDELFLFKQLDFRSIFNDYIYCDKALVKRIILYNPGIINSSIDWDAFERANGMAQMDLDMWEMLIWKRPRILRDKRIIMTAFMVKGKNDVFIDWAVERGFRCPTPYDFIRQSLHDEGELWEHYLSSRKIDTSKREPYRSIG